MITNKYIHRFATEDEYTLKRELAYDEPWLSYTDSEGELSYNKTDEEIAQEIAEDNALRDEWLTFEIISGGTIYLRRGQYSSTKTISYKKNSSSSWTSLTANTGFTATITVNAGDKVYIKSSNTAWDGNSFSSSTDCYFSVRGNILTLIHNDMIATSAKTNFIGSERDTSYILSSVFKNCNGIVDASNIVFPVATNGIKGCFSTLFANCKSLVKAPKRLQCQLGGVNIGQVGEYNSMFAGCTALTESPIIMSSKLGQLSCKRMFENCSNLNKITCLAKEININESTSQWVSGISSTGTFIKPRGVDWGYKTFSDGIPDGWTVIEI